MPLDKQWKITNHQSRHHKDIDYKINYPIENIVKEYENLKHMYIKSHVQKYAFQNYRKIENPFLKLLFIHVVENWI